MKSIDELKNELLSTENRIIKVQPKDSHIDSLSKHFHLGMVGGSGKNNYRLNKRREAYLDRSIQSAKILTELYNKRDILKKQIEDIESGANEKKEQNKANRNSLLAEYWKGIKVGDKIDIGGNSPVIVTKKNSKSIETGSGCKWTVSEIIGKEGAKLI